MEEGGFVIKWSKPISVVHALLLFLLASYCYNSSQLLSPTLTNRQTCSHFRRFRSTAVESKLPNYRKGKVFLGDPIYRTFITRGKIKGKAIFKGKSEFQRGPVELFSGFSSNRMLEENLKKKSNKPLEFIIQRQCQVLCLIQR